MKGKICVVAHGAHGYGLAGAVSLASAGAVVVVSDRDFADTGTSEAFAKAHPGLEPTATLEPDPLVSEVTDRYGQVDVLVCAANIPAQPSPIEKTSLDTLNDYLEMVAVEPFQLARAVIGQMKDRKAGKIVFITSAVAVDGLPGLTAYCTAHGATNSLLLTISEEVAVDNIQVNAIGPDMELHPTFFPKEMVGEPASGTIFVNPHPPSRKATPADAGELIAFLASSGSDFISGQILPFYGGRA